VAEGNGTQRDIGAISASLDALREYMETQVRALSDQIADVRSEVRAERFAVQEREARSPDRTINILGLIAAVLVPFSGGLFFYIGQSGEPVARDLYWLEKNQVAMWESVKENRDEIANRAAMIAELHSFKEQQDIRNARVDRNADRMAELAVEDKDLIEREETRNLRRMIEQLQVAVGHLRAANPYNLPGGALPVVEGAE